MTEEPRPSTAIDVAALAAVAQMFRATPLAQTPDPPIGKSIGTVVQGIILAALMWLGSVVVQTSNTTIRLEAGMVGINRAIDQKNDRDVKQDADIAALARTATANAAAIATQLRENERMSDRVDILEGGRAINSGRHQ